MRGTLHLLPAEDLSLYVAVLGTRWSSVPDSWLRGHGVTRAQFEAIVEKVPRALDGRPRTREQLADRLADSAGSEIREVLLSGWGALLKPSAHRGELCFGPNRGRNVTFVRPDRWLGRLPRIEPEEATRELLRRYLAAYGPSSADDLGRWLGLRGAAPKRMLASLAGELAEVSVATRRATLLTADVPALENARAPRSLRLLPAFDPYVVGSRPREDFVAPGDEPAIFRAQGWVSPVLLVDGQAAGVWSHERRGREVEVRVEPFARLAAWTREPLREEVERLGAFLGAPARLATA
jgi:Winged helix DNA-binding domain